MFRVELDHVLSWQNNKAWDVSGGQILRQSLLCSMHNSNQAITIARSKGPHQLMSRQYENRIERELWSVNGDIK